MYQLFNQFAHRYDLHTPPGHYQHDHAFVIAEALRVAPNHCRLLDVGCGTGVFLETACAAGIDGHGLDASKVHRFFRGNIRQPVYDYRWCGRRSRCQTITACRNRVRTPLLFAVAPSRVSSRL